MKKKQLKVTIEWKLLERIAEYYGFPVTVFLHSLMNFPKQKTRDAEIREKAEKYDRIKDVVDGWNW